MTGRSADRNAKAGALAAKTIATLPRGGPYACWLDRQLETDELEYLDRDDAPDDVKQSVIRMLDRLGSRFHLHEKSAHIAVDVISDIREPSILELGAGHGQLSSKILDLHPTAVLTISDIDPVSVANIASGDLGQHPRVRTQVVDATAIDAPDDAYDLVVLAQAFHHLRPALAAHAIAEATRVGRRFLVIDLERRPPMALLGLTALKPLLQTFVFPSKSLRPLLHDAHISALRAYSRSALKTLAQAADPAIEVTLLQPISRPASFVAVFSRPNADPQIEERKR